MTYKRAGYAGSDVLYTKTESAIYGRVYINVYAILMNTKKDERHVPMTRFIS